MSPENHLSSLGHNELIAYMAAHCGDNAAWREFIERFHKFIISVIVKECQRMHFQKGLQRVDDLLHMTYLRLLQNDSKALKSFKGQYENSIIHYLKLITLNVVRSEFKQSARESRQELLDSKDELIDLLPDHTMQDKLDEHDLHDTLQQYLSEIAQQRRNGERDVLIFQYRILGGFEIDEIVEMPEFKGLSSKRAANIVAEIKDEIRNSLAIEGLV